MPLAFILIFLFHYYFESNSHYKMSGKKPGESPQDILKRIEAESAERKRQRTVELLQRKAPEAAGSPAGQWWKATWSRLQAGYAKSKKNFLRVSRVKENRHIALITLFLTASMWVTWQVEDKYDKLRRRARTSKSMKQKQVQSENEYINRMLAKNPFAPVPIQDEEEEEASYIFQKADVEFDTRADLMEVLQEENRLLDQED